MREMENLLRVLKERYRKKTKRSCETYQKAKKLLIRGGSHTLRLWQPYPFLISQAKGPLVFDVDGNSFLDYWQGHYANILGHNPDVINSDLQRIHKNGSIHTGFEGESQIELAQLLLSQLGYKNHKVRFTTSGTLATMYALMLAQAYTNREYVLKIGGGWHGASPYFLKGIRYYRDKGFERGESAGLAKELLEKIVITQFNQDMAMKLFQEALCLWLISH